MKLTKRQIALILIVFACFIFSLSISLAVQENVFESKEVNVATGCWPNAVRCDRLNEIRINHGLKPLAQREHLQFAASLWALHMKNTQTLQHNPDLAEALRIGEIGGENVGYGPDWRTVFKAFMNSPGHRANMLDKDWTHVGIGTARDSSGRVWVVIEFHG